MFARDQQSQNLPHRLAYNRALRQRQIYHRLKLDISSIDRIKNSVYETCCLCSGTGSGNPWRHCIAVVKTETLRGKWPDRYLCQTHFEEVQGTIGSLAQSIGATEHCQPEKMPYDAIVLKILGDRKDWIPFSLLIAEAPKYRIGADARPMAACCKRMRDDGRILFKKVDGKAYYRAADVEIP